MRRRRHFWTILLWTIFCQGDLDNVCKTADRCMMAAQFRPNMVNMALPQGGKLTAGDRLWLIRARRELFPSEIAPYDAPSGEKARREKIR